MTLGIATKLAPDVAVNLVQPAMIDPPPDLDEAGRVFVGSADDGNRLFLIFVEGSDFASEMIAPIDGGRFLGPSAS